jgi:hypothetical protein
MVGDWEWEGRYLVRMCMDHLDAHVLRFDWRPSMHLHSYMDHVVVTTQEEVCRPELRV